jgi:hypothetical protein
VKPPGRRGLAVLLAMLWPPRGRHQLVPGADDTLVFPRVPPGDDEDQGDEKTRLDLSRARPYLRPGDDGGDYPRWLP